MNAEKKPVALSGAQFLAPVAVMAVVLLMIVPLPPIVLDLLLSVDIGLAVFINKGIPQMLCELPPEQQHLARKYVPDLLAGRTMSGACISEPDVGSNPAAVKTRVTRNGATLKIRGEKVWITNGDMADVVTLYAITDRAKGAKGGVTAFLVDRVSACEAAGIGRGNLLVDPGFGFGKTRAHNLALLRALRDVVGLGLPVLVGLSRKALVGTLTGKAVADRLGGSVALAVVAALAGARVVRVHDVAPTVDAMKVIGAVTRESPDG